MKKDLNTLIESFFARKENVLTGNTLEQIIRKQFKTLSEQSEYGKVDFQKGYPQGGQAKPASKGKELTVKYSFIPEISVSELGWSTLETREGGDPTPRRQLEEYLKNIPGDTFKEKVQKINQFYSVPVEQLDSLGFFKRGDDSRAGRIQQIISYLVFLKTLTTIITNFNAASAGFAFEAFLGVLLGGTQVKANTGTIADLTAPDSSVEGGVAHISLKLYAEKSVHVGGSFTDLAIDLAGDARGTKKPLPAIRYIVVTKSLKGEKLETAGEISIYQFDITKENIFNIMALTSGESKQSIRLPKRFIESDGKTEFSSLKITRRTPEQVQEFFEEDIQKVLTGNAIISSTEYAELISRVEALLSDKKMWSGIKGEEDPKLGTHTPAKNAVKSEIKKFYLNGDITFKGNKAEKKDIKDIETLIIAPLFKCYDRAKEYGRGIDLKPGVLTEAKEHEDQIAPGEDLASVEESIAFYNKTSNKELALRNTFGYLKEKQFGMTLNQMFDIMSATNQGGKEPIAKIIIGRKNIEDMLNKLTSNINQEIFEIFDNLSSLTQNINTYFATGLKNDAAAETAQTAALNIDKKTEQIRTKSK